MFRVGDGLAETVAREIGSDVGWFALGTGDGYSWSAYRMVREIATRNGVRCFPWERLYDPDDMFGLMYEAERNGTGAILNIENEFESSLPPRVVRDILDEFPDVEVAVSTVGWIYNSVDLAPLARLPFLLQCFATDAHWSVPEIPSKIEDCIRHARVDHGLTYVGVTVQTYGDAKPFWYSSTEQDVRSYYTGETIGAGGWEQWKPGT